MLLYLKYKVIKGYISVVDPDLQIRGRGRGGGQEGGYRDPEIRWEPGLKKNYFGLWSLTLV